MKKQTRVLLVDGFNLIRRIYEAQPHTDDVLQPEVIVSAAASLGRVLHSRKPTHTCCAFDSHEKSWRHLLYSAYKENRKPTPQVLLNALPQFEAAFLELNVPSIFVPGYEADDVIATLAHRISEQGGEVCIVSTDKGFLQLLDQNISIYNYFTKMELTPEWVSEKYGVTHEQLVDYWALTGDATNNIKGVPKIGPKTAQSLIAASGTLAELLRDPPTGTVGDRITGHVHEAQMCRQLVCLKTDVEIGINLNQLRYKSE